MASGTDTGKGRPTPTRKEARERRKQSVKPASSRREAMQRDRASRRDQRAARRAGLTAGDERYLPRRDKGPVRKFVRDYVDSRRSLAGWFLPIAVVTVLASFTGNSGIAAAAYLVFFAWFFVVIGDWVLLARGLRRRIDEKFSDLQGERMRSLYGYAFMRSTQLRRLRIPAPKVEPGDRV